MNSQSAIMDSSSRRLRAVLGHVQPNTSSRSSSSTIVSQQTSAKTADEPSVKYEVLPGRIGLITLNRPTRGNAFTIEMQQSYMDCLDRANADENVGVIIVTGAGKMFCVGADKDDLTVITPKDGDSNSVTIPMYHRDVAQVRALELDKPVICVVNGACAGLGFVAACMADLRFATKNAKFTTSFVKRGLVAEHGVTYTLPRIIGISRALDMLLSARVVSADEALGMGLVNQLYPDQESALKAAIEYARELIRFCSPAAMSEIRRQVYGGWHLTPREEALKADSLMRKSFRHPDFVEGVASLVEKRDPKYPGLKAGFIRDIR